MVAAGSVLDGLIEAHEIAAKMGVSMDFIQRRLSNPEHPQHIPNIKIGRKRYVYDTDLRAWLERQKSA